MRHDSAVCAAPCAPSPPAQLCATTGRSLLQPVACGASGRTMASSLQEEAEASGKKEITRWTPRWGCGAATEHRCTQARGPARAGAHSLRRPACSLWLALSSSGAAARSLFSAPWRRPWPQAPAALRRSSRPPRPNPPSAAHHDPPPAGWRRPTLRRWTRWAAWRRPSPGPSWTSCSTSSRTSRCRQAAAHGRQCPRGRLGMGDGSPVHCHCACQRKECTHLEVPVSGHPTS